MFVETHLMFGVDYLLRQHYQNEASIYIALMTKHLLSHMKKLKKRSFFKREYNQFSIDDGPFFNDLDPNHSENSLLIL